MFVPVILGTARQGNKSQNVANVIAEAISKHHETEIIKPQDYLKNFHTERLGKEREFDESGKRYQEIINKADAIVVVLPEYNRSFPGELKLLIDLLYEEYRGKKFYLVGVSDGGTGGTRAVESFMHVVVGVEAIPMKPRLIFSNVDTIFDDKGQILKEDYVKRISDFVSRLAS